MEIELDVVNSVVPIKDKQDLFRIHLFIKLIEKGKFSEANFSSRELSIMCLLHSIGGTDSKEDLEKFITMCIEQKLCNESKQSIRNLLSKGRNIGVLTRKKVNKWSLSTDYIPVLTKPNIAFKYTLHNAV